MPRSSRGSESSRRPRAAAGASGPIKAQAKPSEPRGVEIASKTENDYATPRFRIFIIDSGWNSAAHQVLQENFGLIRDLQKEDPIYVLSKEQSIELIRHHQDRIGREPLIAVHDLAGSERDGRFPRFPAASRPHAHATAGAARFAELCPFPEYASPLGGSRGGNSHRSPPRRAGRRDRDHIAS